MQRRDTAYLRHILDGIGNVERYIRDFDKVGIRSSTLVQDAVVRQLETIEEAVSRLSREFRSSHPEVPWQDIAGMCNKLIHDYFGVEIEEVGITAQDDVPASSVSSFPFSRTRTQSGAP